MNAYEIILYPYYCYAKLMDRYDVYKFEKKHGKGTPHLMCYKCAKLCPYEEVHRCAFKGGKVTNLKNLLVPIILILITLPVWLPLLIVVKVYDLVCGVKK